jgi:hypothetical protein
VYDSLTWVQRFGDPTFAYHVTTAQLWGLLALRMADAPVLPHNYSEVATAVRVVQRRRHRLSCARSVIRDPLVGCVRACLQLASYVDGIETLLESEGGSGRVSLDDVAAAVSDFATQAAQAEGARLRCAAEPSPCSQVCARTRTHTHAAHSGANDAS